MGTVTTQSEGAGAGAPKWCPRAKRAYVELNISTICTPTPFYITISLILAYFNTVVERLETLSKMTLMETKKCAIWEEKLRFSLEFHDGVKPIISASRLVLGKLAKQAGICKDEIADELQKVQWWVQDAGRELILTFLATMRQSNQD